MKKKILLVDDEPHFVTTVKDRLEMMGYEIVTASNGKEALEKVDKGVPDLILLDVQMPELDGLEVANRLKSSDKTKSIPIIMLTAKGQLNDVGKAVDIGVKDYIVKPFDPHTLAEKIKAVLA